MKDYKLAYQQQRNNAKARKIDWQFTFETWLEWWGDAIEFRGCKSGQLCMSRFNDQGPYHPDNVKKITHGENVAEACVRRKGERRPPLSQEHKERLSQALKGRAKGPFSEEHKAKLSAWQKGKSKSSLSEEHKAHISIALKNYHQGLKEKVESV